MSPYGDYDTVIRTVAEQLRPGPYLLGDRFTAADILWGTALKWMTGFKIVPALPEIVAYVERISARPASARVGARDAELPRSMRKRRKGWDGKLRS
jgi:glutathione S-transferase